MSILFAALSPNISAAQLKELFDKDMEQREELTKLVFDTADAMEPEQAMEYLNLCVPLLTAF